LPKEDDARPQNAAEVQAIKVPESSSETFHKGRKWNHS